jgi:hypothetical protein
MFVYPADKKVSQPSILTINTKRLKRKSGGGGGGGVPLVNSGVLSQTIRIFIIIML